MKRGPREPTTAELEGEMAASIRRQARAQRRMEFAGILGRIAGPRPSRRTPAGSRYTPADGTYKPSWKLAPDRVLGSGPPKDWRS